MQVQFCVSDCSVASVPVAKYPPKLGCNACVLLKRAHGNAPIYSSTCMTSSLQGCLETDQDNPCSFNAGRCCGIAASRRTDDVTMLRTIVNWCHAHLNTDPKVFLSGFSNGGMLANRAACKRSCCPRVLYHSNRTIQITNASHVLTPNLPSPGEMSDRIRAVAPVGAALEYSVEFPACIPENPVPYVGFCGGADSYCNFFREAGETWAVQNGCDHRSSRVSYTTATTTCRTFDGCAAATEWCVVDSMGHRWPGRALPSRPLVQNPNNIDATLHIIRRFAALIDIEYDVLMSRRA